MSVNLDRLRESMREFDDGLDPYLVFDASVDTARAVLDAPRVWWCDGRGETLRLQPSWCNPRTRDAHHTCGWVVLVPVEGEGL
jgi:hypothetical protein